MPARPFSLLLSSHPSNVAQSPSVNPQTSSQPILRTPPSLTLTSAGLSRPTVPDIISENAETVEETANVHDAVFGLMQGRLAGLLGKSSGYIESILGGAKMTTEALRRASRAGRVAESVKRECPEL